MLWPKAGCVFVSFTIPESATLHGDVALGLTSYQAGNAEEDGSVKLHNGNVARGVSIAQVLCSAGYYTAISGKWHISPEPRALGFDRFFGFLEGYIRIILLPKNCSWTDTVMLDGKAHNGLITNHGIEFIEEAHDQKKPFLLICPTMRHTILFRRRRKKLINTSGNTIRVGSPFANAVSKNESIGTGWEDWIPASSKEVKLREWNALSEDDRKYQDLLMATYAGMVDRIDQNIGKLVRKLNELGQFENTLIIFFSDNGACEATMLREREMFERSIPTSQGDSFTTIGADWAFVSNTPYRFFKAHMHEGGINSPCIVHWPKGISLPKGTIDHQNVFHLMDIMPTIVDLSGATYPEIFEGRSILPMNGVSMVPALKGKRVVRDGGIYQVFGVNRAYRLDGWKLVSKGASRWELYNMNVDPTEQNDLASQLPEKVESLKNLWWKVAIENERLPERISRPCTDNPAQFRRFMMNQGNQRVPDLNLKSRVRRGKK